ncbi:hypothetical protein LCGC14_0838640 [marine sediment metagenome]|uniref:O-antigen ligase-related domain-containing protein n=1 Tax=marine sediment metagenome TaxID=412755 RepID=A0A0F9PDT7_9ZZZZ
MRGNSLAQSRQVDYCTNTSLRPVSPSRILVDVVCVLCVVIMYVDLFHSRDPEVRMLPHLLRAAILGIFILVALGALWGRTESRLSVCLYVYAVVIAVPLVCASGSTRAQVFELSKLLMWPFGTIAVYVWTLHGHVSRKRIAVVAGLMLVAALVKSLSVSLDSSSSIYRTMYAYPYFMLFCIPLLLVNHVGSKRTVCLVAIAVCAVLLTFKRGALIALCLSVLAYYLGYRRCCASQKRVRVMNRILLLVGLLVGALVVLYREDLLLRWGPVFDAGAEDSSGRNIYYSVVLGHWASGSTWTQIWGYGMLSVPQSVEDMGHVGAAAHSDWLQLLHNQGVVGVIVFVGIHVAILRTIYEGLKNRHPVAPVLAMGAMVFMLANVYSGCTGDPTSMLCYAMLVGYSAARIKMECRASKADVRARGAGWRLRGGVVDSGPKTFR